MMTDSRLSFRTLTAAAGFLFFLAVGMFAFPTAWTSVEFVFAAVQGFAVKEPVTPNESTAASPAAAFTPGNLVVYRVGDGSAALGSGATAIFLDEYTAGGVLVQSIALPTASNGANRRITGSGSATSEGLLTRSTDGRYLVLVGYDAALGQASIGTSTSATFNRVIARVGANASIDTTTALTDAFSGSSARGAASADGSSFWLTGGNGGVRYATLSGTTSTVVSSTVANLRGVSIFENQLYISTASGSAVRIGSVGSGLPTSTGATITNLPSYSVAGSPHGFFFADLNTSVLGVDTLYVVDDGFDQIQKYSLTGGAWDDRGTVAATDVRGLTASVDGSTVTLFATSGGTAGGGTLFRFIDTSGYDGTISGTVTPLATAATNTAFRGVALAPVQPTAPAIQVTGGPLNFGDRSVNTTSASQSITVTNTGSANLVLGTPTFTTGTQFAFTSNPNGTVVAPAESTTVSFTFTPTSTGAKSDTVTINSNAPGPAPTVTLSGNGLASEPEISVSEGMNFGLQAVGTTSATRSVTISNTGTGDLNVGQLVKGGSNPTDFTITSDPSNTVVAAGGSARIVVTFSPGDTGARSASITIPSNDADEPSVVVNLSGSGVAAGTPDPVKSMWVWTPSPNPVTDPAARTNLILRASADGITDLYVSVRDGGNINAQGWSMYPTADVAALIAGAHAAGIKVWYASGDPAWQGQPCSDGQSSYERMQEVVAYNNFVAANERFDGVMVDVEPGAAFDVSLYIGIHQCYRGILSPEIKLGTAINAFWESSVEYPTGGETKPEFQHIIDNAPLDQFVVMGYRDNAGIVGGNGIIGLDEDEIAYASSTGRAGLVLAGLETKDVAPGEPENVTFFEEGNSVLDAEAGLVASHFASSTGFGGFSIHAYGDEYLSGIAGWPTGVPLPVIGITDVNFGNVIAGTTGSGSVTISNTAAGSGPLTLDSFTLIDNTAGWFNIFSSPSPGTQIPPNATVQLTCSPPANAVGTQTASLVVASDSGPGGDSIASLSCTAVAPNTPPVAVDDERSTPKDQQLVLAGSSLVANDIDPDPQALTVTAVSNSVNGTVGLVSGTITFTPTAAFTGAASFDYTVSDGVDSDTGRVNVTVTAPVGQFAWSSSGYSFTENGGFQNLTIQRTNGSAGTVDVSWGTSEGTANGENDCAAGVDFEMRPGVVQFLDGETSKTVSVGVCDDAVLEPNETFTATLVTASGGSIDSPGVATVTIRDNEPRTRIVDRLDDLVSADECDDATPNDCSLRRAIATSNDGDTITFDIAAMGIEGAGAVTITLAGSSILIDKDLTITGPGADQLTVSGNNASGVFEIISSTVRMSGLTVTGGSDSGILVGAGAVTFDRLHVTGNSGTNGAGLRYIGGGDHVILSSTFSNNQATGAGGGINADAGSFRLTIVNSTISGNSAGVGGGMWTDAVIGEIRLISSTITANAGGTASGFVNDGAVVMLGNSIIAGNSSPGVADVDGSFDSLGFNLIGNAGVATGFGAAGDQAGSSGTPIDPKLASLGNNGGTTPTHAFNAGSPAIDMGSSSILTDADQTDQRGQARPVDLPSVANAVGGDGSDIGAYELMAPTAAAVSISGRVTTANGRAIGSALITVQGIDGALRSASTNTSGYYRVEGLTAGESFVVTVSAGKYAFAEPTQFVTLGDSIEGVDFRALR